jgi:hypothetical protein
MRYVLPLEADRLVDDITDHFLLKASYKILQLHIYLVI